MEEAFTCWSGKTEGRYRRAGKLRKFDYYEYPDSVILSLQKITELPPLVNDGRHTFEPEEKITLNPNIYYFSFDYGR